LAQGFYFAVVVVWAFVRLGKLVSKRHSSNVQCDVELVSGDFGKGGL